jgi:hypothetical protein
MNKNFHDITILKINSGYKLVILEIIIATRHVRL